MLAYGTSQRTLRFSCQDSTSKISPNPSHEIDLTGKVGQLGSPLDYPGFNSASYPPRLKVAVTPPKVSTVGAFDPGDFIDEEGDERLDLQRKRRGSNTVANTMSRANTYGRREQADRSKISIEDQRAYHYPVSENTTARRPQFRLEMDLGSESDSSDSEVEDNRGHGQGASRNGENELQARSEHLNRPDFGERQRKRTKDFRRIAQGNTAMESKYQMNHHSSLHQEKSGASSIPNSTVLRSRWDEGAVTWEDVDENTCATDRVHSSGGREDEVQQVEEGKTTWSRAPFVSPDHLDRRGKLIGVVGQLIDILVASSLNNSPQQVSYTVHEPIGQSVIILLAASLTYNATYHKNKPIGSIQVLLKRLKVTLLLNSITTVLGL